MAIKGTKPGQAQADTLTPWLGVLLAPVSGSSPSRQRRGKGKPSREEQAHLDRQLWAAIDAADPVALERALDEGANPRKKRVGVPPAWAAAAGNRMDMARVLVRRGGDIRALGKSGLSAWAGIAPRNDVAEGQALAELAGGANFGTPSEFLFSRAYDLLEWWLGQGDNARNIPRPTTGRTPSPWSGKNLAPWIGAAFDGPASLAERVNRAWGVREGHVRELVGAWGPSMGRAVWEELARRDNVALAQRVLGMGWGPPLPADFDLDREHHKEMAVSPLWAHGAGWVFLAKQATHLWKWWMGAQGLRDEFLKAAIEHPLDTVWQVARDVPALDRLVDAGVPLGGVDEQGNALLHHLATSAHLSAALGRWFLAHRPQDFHALNAAGVAPLDQPLGGARAKARAAVKALVLEAGVGAATGVGRGRTRL